MEAHSYWGFDSCVFDLKKDNYYDRIDKGVETDLFVIGERLSFLWFPFTLTASHLDLIGRFIQDLIKDIENDVDVLAKVRAK